MKNGDMPAMPQAGMVDHNGVSVGCEDWGGIGLTKREEFAARAIQGIAAHGFSDYSGKAWASDIAEEAIQLADALLQELDK